MNRFLRWSVGALAISGCSSTPPRPRPRATAAQAAKPGVVRMGDSPGGVEEGRTIPFPLDFAPNLPYRGTEELRFAPGFFDPSAAGSWSYAFVWFVDRTRAVHCLACSSSSSAITSQASRRPSPRTRKMAGSPRHTRSADRGAPLGRPEPDARPARSTARFGRSMRSRRAAESGPSSSTPTERPLRRDKQSTSARRSVPVAESQRAIRCGRPSIPGDLGRVSLPK